MLALISMLIRCWMFRVDFNINTWMWCLYASVSLVHITTELSLTHIFQFHTYSLYNEKALCVGTETIFSRWNYYLELHIRIRVQVDIHIISDGWKLAIGILWLYGAAAGTARRKHHNIINLWYASIIICSVKLCTCLLYMHP